MSEMNRHCAGTTCAGVELWMESPRSTERNSLVRCRRLLSFFLQGKLVSSVAVSTADRLVSRSAAFLQAEDRSMVKGLMSDSTARNHVYLGRPTGHFQSGGGFRIAAEAAR